MSEREEEQLSYGPARGPRASASTVVIGPMFPSPKPKLKPASHPEDHHSFHLPSMHMPHLPNPFHHVEKKPAPGEVWTEHHFDHNKRYEGHHADNKHRHSYESLHNGTGDLLSSLKPMPMDGNHGLQAGSNLQDMASAAILQHMATGKEARPAYPIDHLVSPAIRDGRAMSGNTLQSESVVPLGAQFRVHRYVTSDFIGNDDIQREAEALEEQGKAKKVRKPHYGVLHPFDEFRYKWDISTMVAMVWVIIDVPFVVAFDIEVDPHDWDWHRCTSFVVDVFFMLDVLISFNTGVELAGIVSLNRFDIAREYLKSWFWIDLISGFPLDLVLEGQDTKGNAGLAKLAKTGKVIRMFKLVRLLRIARVARVVSRLEYTMSTIEAVRTLWKFFAVVTVTAHLLSCTFYAIGYANNDEVSWANGIDSSVDTVYKKYVAAFYWSIMTITTVGYGDVSCRGQAQRLFGMLAMVIGALLFGYGVSNVVNIVEELRSGERKFREKMDKFNQYMRSQEVSLPLQDAVRDYLKNVQRVQMERISVDDEMSLLSQLSLGLREEIAIAVRQTLGHLHSPKHFSVLFTKCPFLYRCIATAVGMSR